MSIPLALGSAAIAGFSYYWNIMNLAQTIYSKENVVFKNKRDRIILTLDDIPYGNSFEEILNDLDNYNQCKATFFLISSYLTEKNKPLVLRAIQSGHHIANHGHTNRMHYALSDLELKSEIETCEKLISSLYEEAGVSHPKNKYYRPGSGFISSYMIDYCKENSYQLVLGSNYCSDAQIPLSSVNYFYIKYHLQPNDILILHDRFWTSPLLRQLFSEGMRTHSLLELEEDA
jgi:peptidoglycan/xylan/chitin deacetylase (PgdA/CDA1 family)